MWDLVVSVPDHCLSFYFSAHSFYFHDHEDQNCVAAFYFGFHNVRIFARSVIMGTKLAPQIP